MGGRQGHKVCLRTPRGGLSRAGGSALGAEAASPAYFWLVRLRWTLRNGTMALIEPSPRPSRHYLHSKAAKSADDHTILILIQWYRTESPTCTAQDRRVPKRVFGRSRSRPSC